MALMLNLPSVQGALSVWRPSAQVSAALAHVGSPSVTWFFSGRRPGVPSLASAAASELGTPFPAPLLVASRVSERQTLAGTASSISDRPTHLNTLRDHHVIHFSCL